MLTVLTNARIRTLDPQRPEADTLVIDGDTIAFVGPAAERPEHPGAAVVDLGGRTVIPGFVDSHTHPEMVTKSAWHVRLPWTHDVDELLDFIRTYAAEHPKEEAPFLYFEYYPSTLFAGSAPTKELLDTAVSDRPVLCQDFSEHEHWVNSKMLELMEVTRETPDPVPGLEMFVRDDEGEPTGLLREMVHARFIDTMYATLGWAPPEEITPERLQDGFLGFMAERGVTALFDAMLMDDDVVRSLAALEGRGELHLQYSGAVRFRTLADLPEAIARAQRLDAEFGSDRIRVNALKLFLDGTNESGNSAVLESLCGSHRADDHGEIQMESAELQACFELCSRERIDVHIHLVGDRAFRTACDAAEAAQQALAAAGEEWGTRITLAHCELVDPADMHRPAELGIFVNWTPHWSGAYFGEGAIEHLGEERWNRMYDFTAIARHGATVTFASDVVTTYELHRGDPLFGMQVAHTRVDPEYPLAPERFPGSARPQPGARLPLELLLEGYTINGARQLRIDDRAGSLEAGKRATLNVLSADLAEVEPSALAGIRCDAVLFEGRVISGSLDAPSQ